MSDDDQAPWAPRSADGSPRPDQPSAARARFRPDRPLCEDGFCLGVLRPTDGGTPYRAAPEALCPVCGRRFPLPLPPERPTGRP